MKTFIIVASILLVGCTQAKKVEDVGFCSVYTYFDKPGHNLSGLIYLDKKLEEKLIAQIPNHASEQEYCWYTQKGSIVGKLKGKAHSPSKAFTFKRDNNEWALAEENDVISLPAHN